MLEWFSESIFGGHEKVRRPFLVNEISLSILSLSFIWIQLLNKYVASFHIHVTERREQSQKVCDSLIAT